MPIHKGKTYFFFFANGSERQMGEIYTSFFCSQGDNKMLDLPLKGLSSLLSTLVKSFRYLLSLIDSGRDFWIPVDYFSTCQGDWLVNWINSGLAQTDPIKQRPLYIHLLPHFYLFKSLKSYFLVRIEHTKIKIVIKFETSKTDLVLSKTFWYFCLW